MRCEGDPGDSSGTVRANLEGCCGVNRAFDLAQAVSFKHIEQAQKVALREGGEKQLFGVPPLRFAVKSLGRGAQNGRFSLGAYAVPARVLA